MLKRMVKARSRTLEIRQDGVLAYFIFDRSQLLAGPFQNRSNADLALEALQVHRMLEAIMKPTAEQIDAAMQCAAADRGWIDHAVVAGIWRAMIDEILKSEREGE